MAKTGSERVCDIESPTALAKLNGIQLAIDDLEQQAMALRDSLPFQQGRLKACQHLAPQIVGLAVEVNKQLKAEKIEPEHAKAKAEGIKAVLGLVNAFVEDVKREVERHKYESEGLKKAAEKLARTWEATAVKYERHERMEREEAEEELDALEVERASKAKKAKKAAKKVAPKGRKKASKKAAKKA